MSFNVCKYYRLLDPLSKFLIKDLKALRYLKTVVQPGQIIPASRGECEFAICLCAHGGSPISGDRPTSTLLSVNVRWRNGHICISGPMRTCVHFQCERAAVLLSGAAEKTLPAAHSTTLKKKKNMNSISHIPWHPFSLASSWHHTYSSFHNILQGKSLTCSASRADLWRVIKSSLDPDGPCKLLSEKWRGIRWFRREKETWHCVSVRSSSSMWKGWRG